MEKMGKQMNSTTALHNVPFLNEVVNSDWKAAVKKIPANSIDLLVTDPPYGIAYKSNYRKVKRKSIKNDDKLDWLAWWVKELKRIMKPDAHLYIFCSWHNVDVFKKEIGELFEIKNILIWEKNNTGMGDLYGNYAPKYEMILFASNGQKKLNGNRDSNILLTRRTQNKHHPTEKPVNLLEYLIEKSSKKGDIVLDTFAGSCSTAQACKKTDRNFIYFEIDHEYCTIGRKLVNGTMKTLF